MKKYSLLLLFVAAFLFGCAERVSVPEVLQMAQKDKLYTKYNIWYTDPENISCLNPQTGRILPIGTEVEVVKCTEDALVLKDAKTGAEYAIDFDGKLRMSSMREFVGQTLTTTPPSELLKEEPEPIRDHIIHGEVIPGMNRRQVLLTYGTPAATRTPSLKNSTWIYWAAHENTIRVNFRGDKVSVITNTAE